MNEEQKPTHWSFKILVCLIIAGMLGIIGYLSRELYHDIQELNEREAIREQREAEQAKRNAELVAKGMPPGWELVCDKDGNHRAARSDGMGYTPWGERFRLIAIPYSDQDNSKESAIIRAWKQYEYENKEISGDYEIARYQKYVTEAAKWQPCESTKEKP